MRIVIVGNGVAGIQAAFTARERDEQASITVISGETDYFFSRTALMYAYMNVLQRRELEPYERRVYDRQRIERIRGWVVDLDPAGAVVLEDQRRIPYDRLILAVGASPMMFPWKGVDAVKDGLVHFVSMQDLDACERLTTSTREAVVIGGGLIGIELVECLIYHRVKTTFLIREPYYWPMALGREEGDIVGEHLRAHGVDVRLAEEMTELQVDSAGRVSGIRTNLGNTIACQMLGIAAGVRPNIERIKAFNHKPELARGIVVDATLATSLPNVWACGDCAELRLAERPRPLIEQIWYSAKRQGHIAGRNCFGDNLAYEPPTFYNSSKFFEIEFTTAGDSMTLPEGTPTIFRRMPGKAMTQRILHDGQRVLGFNMMGSRWNHELLVRWIEQKQSPEWVLRHLEEAQFDHEFGRAKLRRMTEQEMPLHKEWEL